MANHAKALSLRDGDREVLESMTRGKSVSASVALRARTVLLAADGLSNVQVGEATGFSDPSVRRWRRRYEELGTEGLDDAWRPGKPREIDELAPVADTLANDGKPPEELGISFSSVARIWRRWKIQPHRIETFKFSTDPALESKLRDVVGLYMSPPENAVVVSIDEDANPGSLAHRQGPAAGTEQHAAAGPRLQAQRHHHPVCRAGCPHREAQRQRLLPEAHERRIRGFPEPGHRGPSRG